MRRYSHPSFHVSSGFTLIELIMVIAILGILAVMALPRFLDLGKDARIAVLKGVVGSLQSAWSMAHAQQLAQGLGSDDSITVEGKAIAMANGYPTQASISELINITGLDTATAGTFKMMDGASPRSDCQVVYNPATIGGSPPGVILPSTTLTSSGC